MSGAGRPDRSLLQCGQYRLHWEAFQRKRGAEAGFAMAWSAESFEREEVDTFELGPAIRNPGFFWTQLTIFITNPSRTRAFRRTWSLQLLVLFGFYDKTVWFPIGLPSLQPTSPPSTHHPPNSLEAYVSFADFLSGHSPLPLPYVFFSVLIGPSLLSSFPPQLTGIWGKSEDKHTSFIY